MATFLAGPLCVAATRCNILQVAICETLFNTINSRTATSALPHIYKPLYGATVHDTPSPHAMWEHNFIQQMKRLREARGMSQTDLAKRLKSYGLPFHQPTVQRIESGERPVRLNEAHLIAKILDVDMNAMTATTTPSNRELHYAVDHLRRASANVAEGIGETMSEWLDDVDNFAYTMQERLPSADEPPRELDPATRWGMAWTVKIIQAYRQLVDAWESLQGIGGKPPTLHFEDAWENTLPIDNIIDVLQEWYERYGDDDVDASSIERPYKLYASFPDTPKSSESLDVNQKGNEPR